MESQGFKLFCFQAVLVYVLDFIIPQGAAGSHSFKVVIEVYDRLLILLFEGPELDLLGLPFCLRGCKTMLDSYLQLLVSSKLTVIVLLLVIAPGCSVHETGEQ